MKARKKEDGKKKFTVFQMIFRKKFQRLKTTSCAALQMHHRACADEVFDDGFFLEKHRDDDCMVCERSQRDPGGDVAGDNLIFGAEGDLVIVLGERFVARFFGLVDGEGEGFSSVMDFQQRSLISQGALVVDRIGEFLTDTAVQLIQCWISMSFMCIMKKMVSTKIWRNNILAVTAWSGSAKFSIGIGVSNHFPQLLSKMKTWFSGRFKRKKK